VSRLCEAIDEGVRTFLDLPSEATGPISGSMRVTCRCVRLRYLWHFAVIWRAINSFPTSA
jgi:hypothetical protein